MSRKKTVHVTPALIDSFEPCDGEHFKKMHPSGVDFTRANVQAYLSARGHDGFWDLSWMLGNISVGQYFPWRDKQADHDQFGPWCDCASCAYLRRRDPQRAAKLEAKLFNATRIALVKHCRTHPEFVFLIVDYNGE